MIGYSILFWVLLGVSMLGFLASIWGIIIGVKGDHRKYLGSNAMAAKDADGMSKKAEMMSKRQDIKRVHEGEKRSFNIDYVLDTYYRGRIDRIEESNVEGEDEWVGASSYRRQSGMRQAGGRA